jgi:CubicO group peptidase (beta-lactamase class C family)
MYRVLIVCLLPVLFISWAPREIACLDAAPTSVSSLFDPIDDIITEAIRERQFPGCQVLVMQGGEVLVDRSYGYLTYDSLMEVTSETVYDLASVTKVAATTLLFMDLYEKGFIQLDDPISCYLPLFATSNKSKITIRQLLAHNSGLQAYVPFWERKLGGDFLDPKCAEALAQDTYGQLQYTHMVDTLNQWIAKSKYYSFKGNSRFLYSDVGFMLLHQIAESASGETMENYLATHFYQPMGLTNTVFNPAQKGIPLSRLAPTELDIQFRKKQVWGEVHDKNALIFNGVAGHAGLFSTSKEIGTLMAMLTNGGQWNSVEYLKPETIQTFNKAYFPHNLRALGFDKKNVKVSSKVSEQSFGHTGFTGTMVWADPAKDMVFVFLSNRVYPDPANRKLITSHTRSRVQDVVYDALGSIETAHLAEVK